jgi:hypothetical protein
MRSKPHIHYRHREQQGSGIAKLSPGAIRGCKALTGKHFENELVFRMPENACELTTRASLSQ